MVKNYLLSAFRNLKKTKLFTLINVVGISIGMASCLLILHYVNFERSYDTFYENSERIYRLRYDRFKSDGTTAQFASCAPPAGAYIRGRYPEVERVARIFRVETIIANEETKFFEDRMYFAEPEFCDIFKLKFIEGDPVNGLKEPNRAFISQSTAKKYFGAQNPVGKTLRFHTNTNFRVVGVFADIPHNSHLKFDILLSFKNLHAIIPRRAAWNWMYSGFHTYLRMKPGADLEAFKRKLGHLVLDDFGESLMIRDMRMELLLQPLGDIHLNSHYMQEYEANGNRDSVNFLFILAFFTIIMAWVNYINLSTAYALTRVKEVALRKVMGASRKQLAMQFFVETLLINAIALILALSLVESALPIFSNVTGIPMSYAPWSSPWFPPAVAGVFSVGVLLSGLYPVWVLTSFKPSRILSRLTGRTDKGIGLRKVLVVFQFVTALVLITGTLSVYYQLEFMKSHDPGFDMKQVLVINAPRLRDKNFAKALAGFRKKLREYAPVRKICVSTEVPGRQILWTAAGIQKAGSDVSEGKSYKIVGIDYDFVDLFDLKFAAGRNFSREFSSDKTALILNEAAVKCLGFENARDAVGKQVCCWGLERNVVGVLKDYRQQSVKEAFEPHIFRLKAYWGREAFSLKIASANAGETIAYAKRAYGEFFPRNSFQYFFLDEYYNRQYQGEELVGRVTGLF
ncbi:MAG: FtsX-like permease family protein, partial [bacterium]|nr:FtsX-like permease family protein [bacterium]